MGDVPVTLRLKNKGVVTVCPVTVAMSELVMKLE